MSQNKSGEKVENTSTGEPDLRIGQDNLDPSLFQGKTLGLDPDPRGKIPAGHDELKEHVAKGYTLTSDSEYIDIAKPSLGIQ